MKKINNRRKMKENINENGNNVKRNDENEE